MPDHTNGKADSGTKQCYELRLVKIAGGEESVVESREIPRDKLEAQASQLPNRVAMSLVNANVFAPINIAAAMLIGAKTLALTSDIATRFGSCEACASSLSRGISRDSTTDSSPPAIFTRRSS